MSSSKNIDQTSSTNQDTALQASSLLPPATTTTSANGLMPLSFATIHPISIINNINTVNIYMNDSQPNHVRTTTHPISTVQPSTTVQPISVIDTPENVEEIPANDNSNPQPSTSGIVQGWQSRRTKRLNLPTGGMNREISIRSPPPTPDNVRRDAKCTKHDSFTTHQQLQQEQEQESTNDQPSLRRSRQEARPLITDSPDVNEKKITKWPGSNVKDTLFKDVRNPSDKLKKCRICHKNVACIETLPCEHTFACNKCSKKCSNVCYVCYKRIEAKFRIYVNDNDADDDDDNDNDDDDDDDNDDDDDDDAFIFREKNSAYER